MKRYLAGNRTAYLFVLLQMVLYVSFLILDFSGSHYVLSAGIKFSIIILCFCFAFFYGKSAGRSIIFYVIDNCVLLHKKAPLRMSNSPAGGYRPVTARTGQENIPGQALICVKTALFFTMVSDLFILMLDYYSYGVITFILVQQLYGIRIMLTNHKKADKIVLRIILQLTAAALICLILWLTGVPLEALLVISVFYFICIVTNTFSAVRSAVRNPANKSNVLFAAGMVLFLLCDINVGIFNMSGFVVLQDNLYHILYRASAILMWTFYAPSQVLIALSISWTWQNNQKN